MLDYRSSCKKNHDVTNLEPNILISMNIKRHYLLVVLLASFCCISSCSKDDPASARSLLGERTCSGTILLLPNPPSNDGPTLPHMILGLRTTTEEYILTCDGSWQSDRTITIKGQTYLFEDGDKAEVTGIASEIQLSSSQSYLELKIKTINKIPNQ